MMQDIFSRHLDIPEGNVRVIARDVGGSFGIKVHVYADEMATAALAVMLKPALSRCLTDSTQAARTHKKQAYIE
jgi:CO/xanthine dehydrogenase Mo-binding subunit